MQEGMLPETDADLDGWIASRPFALTVFTTPDCGVCNAIRPQLDALPREFPGLKVRYVDTNANPALAAAHSVFTVPVLELSVHGKLASRFVRHFSMDEVRASLSRYAAFV